MVPTEHVQLLAGYGMMDRSITSADVNGRARVVAIAQTEPAEALALARNIRHPWYRCQSLATVAEHLRKRQEAIELVEEAFNTAQLQTDTNRIVTVSAWPLRVIASMDLTLAAEHITTLVHLANTEPHTLRRADALYMLARAVEDKTALLELIVPSLRQALLTGNGWRIDRLIRKTVDLIRNSMPEQLDALISHHSEGRQKRNLIAGLR